ncbi:MAG: ABC transporter ATP-binding protein [Candidatus Pelethousia sp.]|nr:ABC transporter ATP-binding protein [Candidatus Pelethousia sp.]
MRLQVEGLDVVLGNKQILHQVELSVGQGEILSLLGPSGSGKSTLLKTIAGLIPELKGTIRLDGKALGNCPPHKRGIVMVFQDLRLFPHLTVEENVAFPLRIAGIGGEERLLRARDMLARVQLADLGKRKPHQLSGGQQQRVVLARALTADPKLLLLDEPFSGLDSNLRADMRDLLQGLHKELGTTLVLVTHDQGEALMLSDRVAVMAEGRIIQCDTPRQLYQSPKTVEIAKYFCGGNQIKGEIRGGTFHSACLMFPAGQPDGTYIAMLRPEDIVLVKGQEDCTILRREYLGDRCRYMVSRNGCALSLMAAAQTQYQPGDSAGIRIPPERILLYPAG